MACHLWLLSTPSYYIDFGIDMTFFLPPLLSFFFEGFDRNGSLYYCIGIEEGSNGMPPSLVRRGLCGIQSSILFMYIKYAETSGIGALCSKCLVGR